MSSFWKVFRIRPTVKMEVPFICAGFWSSFVRMGVSASSRLQSSASIELGEPSAPHMGRPAKDQRMRDVLEAQTHLPMLQTHTPLCILSDLSHSGSRGTSFASIELFFFMK